MERKERRKFSTRTIVAVTTGLCLLLAVIVYAMPNALVHPESWVNFGAIPPTPPFAAEWNPTISASPFGAYFYTATGLGFPAYPPYGAESGIILNMTPGGGAPFPDPSPTLLGLSVFGAT